ncbi:MAG TPA: HAD-IA family hydrolase [Acidimicrobiales bacterium]|nr:HAD-IA family hydrolase [Acidimicrobiales bacterium]
MTGATPVVDAVLFDLGGVVVQLGGVEAMLRLAGMADDEDEEMWRRWFSCRWVRAFERGHCSPEDFAEGVAADWALPVTGAQFLAEFRGWIVGPLPGATELVAEVAGRVPVACLSNTNAVHWEAGAARWDLLQLFAHRFLSFELGLVKPDTEMFVHACDALGLEPERVLLLDDNRINVDAASAAGLVARRTRGVAEARRELAALGLAATS